MHKYWIDIVKICVIVLTCIGVIGCTSSRLERNVDVTGVPAVQNNAERTVGAALDAKASFAGASGDREANLGAVKVDPDGTPIRCADNRAEQSVPEDCGPSYDFPIVRNAQVEELIDYYTTGSGRRSLQLWLERSGRYLPLMQRT